MSFRTLFSRLVSALSALAILNQVITPDTMNLLNTIHPKASAWAAGLGVVGLVATEASVKVSAVGATARGILGAARRSPGRAALLTVALAGVLVFGLGAGKCGGSQTVRGVSAGVSEGAKQFKAEVQLAYDHGDITAAESDTLTAAADELIETSDKIVARAADWPAMTKAQRLDLAGDAVEQIGASVERLSAKNIGIKSEKAKAELTEKLRIARLAVSTLRVIKASLPPAPNDGEPDPTAAPTPTPAPTS